MAATHRDLEMAISERTFREDLYYRLNVINLHLPPLRDRPKDILPLAEFLVRKHSGQAVPLPPLTDDLTHAMMAYHWPGNVRELENVVRKLLVLRDPALVARDLMARVSLKVVRTMSPAHTSTDPRDTHSSPILAQVTKAKQLAETDVILAALNATRWNRKQAAHLLKIDYKALLYKMKKLGLEDKTVPFPNTQEINVPLNIAATGM
jgi:two-component system response regulator AtoC